MLVASSSPLSLSRKSFPSSSSASWPHARIGAMHYHTYIMKMMIKALKPTAFTAFIPFFRLFSPNLSSNFLSIKFFIGEGACVGNRVHGVSLWLIVHILDGTRRHHSKFVKGGQARPLFCLFSFFSNTNFTEKL